jgi:hypothetical protein
MKMEMSSTNTINPKPCNYGCNTRIYWNSSENTYFEVFSKKKHNCPNIISRNKSTTTNNTTAVAKPNYYNKFAKQSQPKPKMFNSFELLQGQIQHIQKKYEILSDIVTEYNGKVHGSQRDRDPKTGLTDLLVYYEVPLGQREEVKRKFNDFVLSIITRTN